ncbi:sensor histidine kinase [Melioribacteraceae bacterium 4301-Me]|uniref:sensor histidine kinase n=1 Tax=Pyranulibacter aquaticus TaxID=3163344 RepID=UPI0035980D86
MKDDLIQTNKLLVLGKLTASLLHEIRNPLTAVKLNLDYIKMYQSNLPEDINSSLDDCYKGILNIQNLIEQLLGFSKKTADQEEFISICEVSDTAIDLVKQRANKINVEIEKFYSDNVPRIYFDRKKLLQVFLNLINNSVDSFIDKGKIKIYIYASAETGKPTVCWEIHDNGCGIKPEDREKIFEDFFTSKKNGVGLGLGLCRSILNEYNAEISFTSEVNKGTTFKIRFNGTE